MNKYTFENFIIQSCKAQEWDLRRFLKQVLKRNGFSILEDDYVSYRGGKYTGVHNMLAIRGKPRVCLVAHTDVCRNYGWNNENETPEPVIKEMEGPNGIRRIIQDKNCEVQVGGDDRLGVAINTWIALNTGYDIALLFCTEEESGLCSAQQCRFPELKEFDLLVEVDRGNQLANQLVSSISGQRICSPEVVGRLLSIANDIGLPRIQVQGFLTDVLAIKENGMCKDAINLSCGYYNSHGSRPDEYIDIEDAKNTMRYVSSIVQHYDLGFLTKETERVDYTPIDIYTPSFVAMIGSA